MRGGYLTIDLSNVHGDTGETLRTIKKGLYRYLEKNTKPIYFIFSDDILKYIFDYEKGPNDNYVFEPNQQKTFLLPCFIDTSCPGRFAFSVGAISKERKINESDIIPIYYLSQCSLYLFVDEDDTLRFGEL